MLHIALGEKVYGLLATRAHRAMRLANMRVCVRAEVLAVSKIDFFTYAVQISLVEKETGVFL